MRSPLWWEPRQHRKGWRSLNLAKNISSLTDRSQQVTTGGAFRGAALCAKLTSVRLVFLSCYVLACFFWFVDIEIDIGCCPTLRESRASLGFAYQDIFQHARTGTEQDEPLRHTLGLTFHQPDHSGRDDQLRLWQDRVGGGVNIVHRLHFEDIAKCIDQSDVGEALHIPSLGTSKFWNDAWLFWDFCIGNWAVLLQTFGLPLPICPRVLRRR